MSQIVDLETARLELKAKKGFKKWSNHFEFSFGISTRMDEIPDKALAFLAGGNQKSSIYYYDLIMNIKDLGSGLEFHELDPTDKIAVIDIYLFLLDRARYEHMKRLEWLASYPGEEYPLVELVTNFDDLAPDIKATPAVLNQSHPCYREYNSRNLIGKEEIIRKLIPQALDKIYF